MGFTVNANVTYRARTTTGQFIANTLTPAVHDAVQMAAEIVVDEAKALVPVDTGALQDSISATVTDTETTSAAKITAAQPYAAYVEFGTGRRGAAGPGSGPYPYNPDWPGMTPRPYMRPALDTTRDAVLAAFKSQLAVRLQK